ncbi:hypothetical protein B0J17DRAFT_633087 [Rhizoctonia solani]|nr:hypothetical protein B0J17DRAFT_633087 [Rhizoctonia solani]
MRLEGSPLVSPTSSVTNETPHPIEGDTGTCLPSIIDSQAHASDKNIAPPFSDSASSLCNLELNFDTRTIEPDDEFVPPILQAGTSNDMGNTHSHEATNLDTRLAQVKDVTEKIPNLFRLLDLVEDRGSGGIVEKVVIDQKSLHKLINTLQPGAYTSVAQIDLKLLDNLSIKPVGVYGDRSEILRFLKRVGSWMILRLYLTVSQDLDSRGPPKLAYLIYWPENTTWDDQASSLSSSIRRNREAFIRYSTCIIGSGRSVCLEQGNEKQANTGHPRTQFINTRVHDFEVFEFNEQEEDVIATPGFTVSVENLCPPMGDLETHYIPPHLVAGERDIGVVVKEMKPAYIRPTEWDKDITKDELCELVQSVDNQPRLVLGDISQDTMDILKSSGLSERYPGVFELYDQSVRNINAQLEQRRRQGNEQLRSRTEQERRQLKEELHTFQTAPTMPNDSETTASLRAWYENSGLAQIEGHLRHQVHHVHLNNKDFRMLKSEWLSIRDRLNINYGSSGNDPSAIVAQALKDAFSALPRLVSGTKRMVKGLIPGTESLNDSDFVSELHQRTQECSALQQFLDKTYSRLQRSLEELDIAVQSNLLEKMIAEGQKARGDVLGKEHKYQHEVQLKEAFAVLVGSLRESMA